MHTPDILLSLSKFLHLTVLERALPLFFLYDISSKFIENTDTRKPKYTSLFALASLSNSLYFSCSILPWNCRIVDWTEVYLPYFQDTRTLVLKLNTIYEFCSGTLHYLLSSFRLHLQVISSGQPYNFFLTASARTILSTLQTDFPFRILAGFLVIHCDEVPMRKKATVISFSKFHFSKMFSTKTTFQNFTFKAFQN